MCGERSLNIKWQSHAPDKKEYIKQDGSKMTGMPDSESRCGCSKRGGQGWCMVETDWEAGILEAMPEDYA